MRAANAPKQALTVAAGPVTDWLGDTANALHAPQAYIAANRIGAGT